MTDTYDAVIIGSGINALVAAAELSGAGWSVCICERNDRIGGFMASDELTLPGFIHDTYSSWHPLFVTGGAHAALGDDLARHGLSYANADGVVTGSVRADGRAVVAHRDPAATVAAFENQTDRDAYLAMLDRLGADLDVIGGVLGTELRTPGIAAPLTQLLRRGRLPRLESWARDTVASGRRWMRRHFTGDEVDQLWAPWLLHAGLGPDSAQGGLMIPLFAGTMHGAGLPVAVGGQGRFVAAFENLLAERGVTVRTGTPVSEILLAGGRAVGVRAGDDRLRATRAVLASVTPQALYGDLLAAAPVPASARTEASSYQYGRGALQIHVAMSRPLTWADDRLAGAPLVHLTDGSGSTGVACAQAEAGLLPSRPTVAVGQQFLMDPSRVPEGRGQLWLQLQEAPFSPVGDAAGTIDVSSGWGTSDSPGGMREAYVERVFDLIEAAAPGTRSAVEKVTTIAPTDLAAYNPNAVDGDPYCGTAELDQNLVWRPGPVTARHRTSVPGVWHIGAATHPGPGLGGGSGHLVAQQLIGSDTSRLATLRRRLPW